MTIIDIRTDSDDRVNTIRFADKEDSKTGYIIAHELKKSNDGDSYGVELRDSAGDYVRVMTRADAENLTRALIKAVSLGWLK